MTATTSKSENSFFGAHFRNKLRELRQLGIVNLVLNVLGLPLISGSILYDLYVMENEIIGVGSEGFMATGSFALVLSIFSGIIFALYSFRYLYSKSLVDMNYSLPVTTKQRFVADYLSGLAVYVIPVIIGALLSLVVMGIGSAFIDLSTFWKNFGHFTIMGIILVLGMILFYTICVFATTCAGALFDAIFASIAVNVFIPVTVFFAGNIVVKYSYESFMNESLLMNPLFNATSPAGIASFMAIYMECIEGYYYSASASSLFLHWLIPAILVIAAFFIATYFLYKNRKAESVSTPYVYKFFYYAIVTMAVFCIMTVFIVEEANILTGFILCGIFYFIMEVASKRGFKKLLGSFVRYGVTIAAVFAFCALGKATYGFGTAKYIPRNSAIDTIRISISGGRNYYSVTTDDEKVIKDTTAVHKEILNRIFNSDDYDFVLAPHEYSREDGMYTAATESYVNIEYLLDNGSTVMRYYSCSTDMLDKIITTICLSDDYCNTLAEQCITEFATDSSNLWFETIEDITPDTNTQVSICNKLDMYVDSKYITYDKLMELYDAYRTDLLAMTEEEFRTAPVYGTFGDSHNYGYQSFIIRSTFRNTIEFLEREGFASTEITAETLEDAYNLNLGLYNDFEAVNPVQGMYENMNINNNAYIDSYAIRYYKQDKFVSMLDYVHTNYNSVSASDLEYTDDLMTLIDKATPIIIGENAAGALYYELAGYNRVLFIPDTPENNELIDRVYEAQFSHIDSYGNN